MKTLKSILFIVCLSLLTGTAVASTSTSEEPAGTCQDAKIFQRLVSDLCWDCIFPVKVAGQAVGPGSMPRGADRSPVCMCDPPYPGITMGAWFPARISEAVKMPSCSPSLGGTDLSLGSDTELGGYHNMASEKGFSDREFRHNHYFAFPVGELLGLVSGCNPMQSFDLLYMTELIATWNDDMLSFFVNPETAIFANPAAVMACAVEAATTGVAGMQPSELLFWCAGSWGGLYPLTGSITYEDSPPADTSLMAARMMAQLHRWGIARKTMGDSCQSPIAPMLPKNQYKLQQYWPNANAMLPAASQMGESATKNHWIGESVFRWGVHKNVPGVEDYLHVVFRWSDCCLEL